MSPSPQVEQSQPQFPAMHEGYDADNSVASTSEDEIIPSIETPNHEFSNAYTNISSIQPSLYSGNNGTRKNSAAYTSVSSIPPSLPYNSDIKPYSPKKGPRAAFRSPSSVRALQMGSPPPFSSPRSGGSPRRHDRYESGMISPSSSRRYRPETPSSLRSGSVMRQEYMESSQSSHGNERETPNAHEQQTPRRNGPIVLLHITLLPCSSPEYSAKSMKELAPGYITENWRLLQEKLTDTVLERGLLISHPGDEFDLLEERVLETLDLCPPRITACGHYYGGDSDSDSGNDSGVADVRGDSKQGRAICSTSHEEVGEEEEDVCHQCDQHIHLPGKGIGAGSRKWDVKIFAANGLMKASAWEAACSDMERVDVEIEPWMPDEVKRALDARLVEEEEEESRQADQVEHLKFELRDMEKSRYEAEAARLRAEERAKATETMRLEAEAARLRAEELAKETEMMQLEAEAAKLHAEKLVSETEALRADADTARLRAEEAVKELKRVISAQAQATETSETADSIPQPESPVARSKTPMERLSTPVPSNSKQRGPDLPGHDIPLSTLLYNYLYLLTQDRRNLVLGFLSILVLVLSYRVVVPQPTPSTIPDLFHSDNYTPSARILISSPTSSLKSPAALFESSATGSHSTAHVQPSPIGMESSSSAPIMSSPAPIVRPESSVAVVISAPAPKSPSTESVQNSSVTIEPISSASTGLSLVDTIPSAPSEPAEASTPGFQSTVSIQSSSLKIESGSPVATPSVPSSKASEAAVSPASTPRSQDAAPDLHPAGKIESTSSSTSVYSPLASKAPQIPRPGFEPEKKAGTETETQTSLKALHSESVSAEQAAFTATSSATTPWTENKQPLVAQSCIA